MIKEKDVSIKHWIEKRKEYVENDDALKRQLENSEIAINERLQMINNLANESNSLKDILAGVIDQ